MWKISGSQVSTESSLLQAVLNASQSSTGINMKRTKQIIPHLSKFVHVTQLHVWMQVLLTVDPLCMLCRGLNVMGKRKDKLRNNSHCEGPEKFFDELFVLPC